MGRCGWSMAHARATVPDAANVGCRRQHGLCDVMGAIAQTLRVPDLTLSCLPRVRRHSDAPPRAHVRSMQMCMFDIECACRTQRLTAKMSLARRRAQGVYGCTQHGARLCKFGIECAMGLLEGPVGLATWYTQEFPYKLLGVQDVDTCFEGGFRPKQMLFFQYFPAVLRAVAAPPSKGPRREQGKENHKHGRRRQETQE